MSEEQRAAGLVPGRVCRVQARRCRVWCPGAGVASGVAAGVDPADPAPGDGTEQTLEVALFGEAGLPTVGDWVLLDPQRRERPRRLEARTTLLRQAPGGRGLEQVLAANVDTLLIVTACNQEFSVARLERYLSLAAGAAAAQGAGVRPVVVLTKADLTEDAAAYAAQVKAVAPGVRTTCLDARSSGVAAELADLCGPGQTVAVLGSSGVGKSTLVNAISHAGQAVGAVRGDDNKGRHTTTARSLHRLRAGGVGMDLPGIRELQLAGDGEGIDGTFAAEAAIAEGCRFRNCGHTGEPGCAVAAALADGTLDPGRWARYGALQREQATHAGRRRERDRHAGRRPRT